MFLTGTVSENLGLAEAGVIALLGYAVVFFGLILLMAVVMALGKSFTAKTAAKSDEDVLSYIAFPSLAEKFFENRKAREENECTYTIVEC